MSIATHRLFSNYLMLLHLHQSDKHDPNKLPAINEERTRLVGKKLHAAWSTFEHPHKDVFEDPSVLILDELPTPAYVADVVKQCAVLWFDRLESGDAVRYYTGVGSRKTPDYIQDRMTLWAMYLEAAGYVLRSGHAEGADWAFEAGVSDASYKEIYKPWWKFNGNEKGQPGFYCPPEDFDNWSQAQEVVRGIFADDGRDYDDMKQGAQKLHGRNVYQVLGQDLKTPSKFVLFWADVLAPNKVKGGTNTAYQIALRHSLPTFNLNSGPNHSFPEDGLLLGKVPVEATQDDFALTQSEMSSL